MAEGLAYPTAYPYGLEDEFPNGPPTVVMKQHGLELQLVFEDMSGAVLKELRVLAEREPLLPRALREFAPQAEIYLAHARSVLTMFGPDGTPESRREKIRDSAEALRAVGGPGRGLSDGFYARIAQEYKAFNEASEPHPVKAIAELHHVTISTASRWITEARQRAYIDPKGAAKNG